MAKRRKKKGEKQREHPRREGPRPIWSGTISFGLVTVPVDLFSVLTSGRVAMRMLAPDGKPLQRRFTCPEEGRDIDADEIVRGFELEDGSFVVLDDDELEAASPRKSRDIDLRKFVDADDIDPFAFERAYVMTPSGDSTKPYRLLAAAMEKEGKAGIATFVMRTKEYLVAILARGGVLWAETLRFAGELRTPEEVGLPEPEKADRKTVKAFADAIDRLRDDEFDREELRDSRVERIRELVAEKQKRKQDVVEVAVPDTDESEAEDGTGGENPFEVIRRRLAGADGRHRNGDGATNGRHRKGAGGDGELRELSKDDLYQRAQELDVPGRSGMTKDELVRALRKHGE